jgi:hypothetical protein
MCKAPIRYEYYLISTTSAEEMTRKVNEMLKQDWEPFMGLVGQKFYLYQWMIRSGADVLSEVKYVKVEEAA